MYPTFYNCAGIVRVCTLTHKHTLARFQPNSRMILEYVLENHIRFVLELYEHAHAITHTHTTQERFSHDFTTVRESCEYTYPKNHALGRFQRNSRMILEYILGNRTRIAPESYECINTRTRTRTIKAWFYYCTRIVRVFPYDKSTRIHPPIFHTKAFSMEENL